MDWQIEFSDQSLKELKALDPQVKREILRFLRERIAGNQDPRRFGKALTGKLLGLWRYRVGDYRIVCQISESRFVVLVLKAAHRKEIYED